MTAVVQRDRFVGAIAGVGSASGVRFVVGRWRESPLGSFADLMLERPDGHRVLYAPTDDVAAFVSATYVFDEVRIAPVVVDGTHDRWDVHTDELVVTIHIGRRPALGWLLRSVPTRIATSTWWAAAIDPIARRAVPGVRTRGSAGGDRREWYGATDLRRVTSLRGALAGTDLGLLAPVEPPCRFGFSSAPRTPSVTEVVTTIERARP